MGNGVGAMKTMTNMLSMGMSDARSGVEREPGEKLPDGERYFGFVNVRFPPHTNHNFRIQTFAMPTLRSRFFIIARDSES
jgi:hypothetical protein